MSSDARSNTLRIESADGASVRAQVFEPRRDEPAYPVCLVLPAMGVRASYYEAFATCLGQSGMPAVTVDLRGQGESSESAAAGSEFGYREIVDGDIPAAVAVVEARFPGRAVLLVGHSLGGQLAALSLALGRVRVDGLVLVAAGSGYWRIWPRRMRTQTAALVTGVGLVSRMLPWYPGRRLGFGGDQPRTLMRDWTRVALTGRYPVEPPAPLSETPVLSLEIDGDPIAPREAAAELLTRFDPAWVIRRALPATRAARAWDTHFEWARDPERIAESIRAWMITGRASRGYGFLRRHLRAG